MNKKREALKKLAGVSAVAAIAPTSWMKPVLNAVILPAHAQTSVNQGPTLSGVSCTFDTPILQVGSVITLEATIEVGADSSVSNIGWELIAVNSGRIIASSGGQFVTTAYTVTNADIGTLIISLDLFSGMDTISFTLCNETVQP